MLNVKAWIRKRGFPQETKIVIKILLIEQKLFALAKMVDQLALCAGNVYYQLLRLMNNTASGAV
jgi:hypothetical protein